MSKRKFRQFRGPPHSAGSSAGNPFSVGKLHSRLKQNLNAIQLIKLYNTESYESSRVEKISLDYYNANWDSITTRIKFFPSLQIISGIGFTMTFLVGGFWVISGDVLWISPRPLYAGEFVTFMLLQQNHLHHQASGWPIPLYQFGYPRINDQ